MATQRTKLYDEDFYQWSREQAAALRRLSAERWNGPLDLEHLAEEVEELGSEVRNAARSHLRRLLSQALKLEYSPASEPRRGWIESIDDARIEIEERLTPTIRKDLEAQLPAIYARALRRTRKALVAEGAPNAADALSETCPYTLEQLLDETWYPTGRVGMSDVV